MTRSLAIFLLLLMASPAAAQKIFQRKRPDIIPLDGKARRGGFYLAPGLTYTLTRFNNSEEEVWRNADTTYSATYDPEGRLGLYLEAGWFLATRDPVVLDYWDFGLAYKNLRGGERSIGTLQRGEVLDTVQGEGAFAERLITLNVNANKFIQVGDYQFIQMSLGANVDYRLGNDLEHVGSTLLDMQGVPPDLIGQVHFKLGYGFKPRGNLLIIPTLETPIFSVVPEDQGFGQLQWFSSRYRPIIFTIRFLFLRGPKGWDCVPVKHNEMERGKHKQYKPDGYHP